MKKLVLIPLVIFSILILIVGVMAIFRLCPPIEAGPQPPWCTNVERFERDFSTNSLTGFMRSSFLNIFPVRQDGVNLYDSSSDTIDYISRPERINDYSIQFGVAPSDYFWPVCMSWSICTDPRKGVISTLSRIESLGGDFVVFTDYARITTDKKIYEDKTALSKKQIRQKLDIAERYNLQTFVLLNLFMDEVSVRHTAGDPSLDDGRVSERSQQMIAMSNWNPSAAEINLLFDRWEPIAVSKAKKWAGADYLVVNPEDLHFHFLSYPEVMNARNKQLIEKVREVYAGKICVHFKELNYVESNPELNFYKDADCVIIGGHPGYSDIADASVDSFEDFYATHFSSSFFQNDFEIYQMISAMSYDKYLQDGWFEVWDYDFLGLNYERDFELQAKIYEGFFRALQKKQPALDGVFHYGYWWEDVDFDEDLRMVEFMNSIRNKDAEHIYYRWAQVLGVI